MSARTAIRAAIGIGVSVAAIALLLEAVDLSGTADRLATLQPGWLLVAPAALAVQLAIRSWRWAFLIETATGTRVRATRVVAPLTVGYLANALLPARLGEIARAILVARRERLGVGLVLGSVVVERALDLAALLTLGIATTGLAVVGWPAIAIGAALVVGQGVLVKAAPVVSRWTDRVAPTRLRAPIADFLDSVAAVGLRASFMVVALSGLAWLGDVALMWAAGRALGIELGLAAAVAIAVGAALGTALPAAGGYIGTYEAGAVAVGVLAGTPPDAALAIAVVAHVLAVVPVALLGAVAVAWTGLPLDRTGEAAAGPSPASA
ncbi:MAG: flippase-like domain-containing protein [Chloroflexi bacterium]|nr:flippase-like domain-containing protein [Chloroflexota bacterium]